MAKKYIVKLTKEERALLEKEISSGKIDARKNMRVRILLKADESRGEKWKDSEIAKAVECTTVTVENIRRKFVELGLEAAINTKQRKSPPRGRIIDGETEAYLIALVCGEAPEGRSRWTLRLLSDAMVELKYMDSVSHETIRQALKKMNLNLG